MEYFTGLPSNFELLLVAAVMILSMKLDFVPLLFIICICIFYLLIAIIYQADPTVVLPVLLTGYLVFGRSKVVKSSENLSFLLLAMGIVLISAWLQAFGFISPEAFANKSFYSRVDGLDVGRTAGVVGNKSSFALICITAIILLVLRSKYHEQVKEKLKSKLCLLVAIFFALSLFIPQGRSELPIAISILLLIFPYLFSKKPSFITIQYTIMFIIILVFLIIFWQEIISLAELIIALGGSHRSWQIGRVQEILVSGSFTEIVFGIGLDQYQVIYNDKVIHNFYWKLLLELGLVSLLLTISLMLFMVNRLFNLFNFENKINNLVWVAAIVASMTIVLSNASIVMNAYFYLFLLLIKIKKWTAVDEY